MTDGNRDHYMREDPPRWILQLREQGPERARQREFHHAQQQAIRDENAKRNKRQRR